MAFGIGDLHMPPGWGNLPWAALAAHCTWPEELMAALEVLPLHRAALPEAVVTARAWLGSLHQPAQAQAA